VSGKRRRTFARIFGARRLGCSRLNDRISISTWNGRRLACYTATYQVANGARVRKLIEGADHDGRSRGLSIMLALILSLIAWAFLTHPFEPRAQYISVNPNSINIP